MALTKWDPFRDLFFLHERMSRIFDEALLKYKGCSGLSGIVFPPVDIYETEESIVFQAELPGLKINDVDIEVKGSTLLLKGEMHKKDTKGENYHRMERFYGKFQRSFSLPYDVESSKIKAGFKDGVLKISVPKIKAHKRGSIKVQIQ